ncbi:MAG: universal stress protein [Caulobacterales bacterium]|nr:universal stress protein [Caulobacterales bacterium]
MREIIFVPLDGGEGDAQTLPAARALADAPGADVQATLFGYDEAATMLIAGDAYTGLGAGALQALRDERENARGRARVSAEEAGASFRDFTGPRINATSFARIARFAVVDAAAARGEGALSDVFDSLLFEDGAAVLVPRGAMPPRRIGVAWDGSREAARAMKVAAPLFVAAPESVVMQAPSAINLRDEGSADPELAREWIVRRGVEASVTVIDARGDPGAALLEACRTEGVDLLVAGAYGHTRLHEAVFGGVTRSLVRADSPSLFLAH